ncbi:MAG: glycosyltransferase [Verrucomicrobiales bacterium]
MTLLPYSVVIATLDRPDDLRRALRSLRAQAHPPAEVVVADASEGDASRLVCASSLAPGFRVRHLRCAVKSAAQQRNDGAALATTPLIAFMDDDAAADPDCLAELAEPFADGEVAGVSGRMRGSTHSPPRGLLRLYYRLQAGYPHPHYGAKLIGPAISCFPCYEDGTDDLIAADWLNTGCVLYRADAFRKAGGFPRFQGYSPFEDVYLSAAIARRGGKLYFHRAAYYDHYPKLDRPKQDRRRHGAMHMRNRELTCRGALGMAGASLYLRLFLHRLFVSAAILRGAGSAGEKLDEILGTWQANKLAN